MAKLILTTIFFIISPQKYNWETIHDKREYSVSGISKFKDGFLVVHDNKRKDQSRISYINQELKIKNLIWPKIKLPNDLEASIQVPGVKNRYILMESGGKCFEISIDPKDFRVEVIHTFTLPLIKPKMNLEGLTIFPSGQGLLFIYGDRGSDSRLSTLFTSFFNKKNKTFYDINQFTFDLPEPKKHKRNISDLALDEDGNLWTVATSDPGNYGPFISALYQLGKISPAGLFKPNHPDLIRPIAIIKEQKVDALMFNKDYLILMTDNENLGSKIKFMKL